MCGYLIEQVGSFIVPPLPSESSGSDAERFQLLAVFGALEALSPEARVGCRGSSGAIELGLSCGAAVDRKFGTPRSCDLSVHLSFVGRRALLSVLATSTRFLST